MERNQIYYSQVLEGVPSTLGPHGEVEGRDRGRGVDGALPLLGSESEVSIEFLGFTIYWLIESVRAGIIAQEGESRVIQRDNSINYLDYLGLSKRGSPWVGKSGPLSGWFVSINNCVIELAMCLFRMDIF